MVEVIAKAVSIPQARMIADRIVLVIGVAILVISSFATMDLARQAAKFLQSPHQNIFEVLYNGTIAYVKATRFVDSAILASISLFLPMAANTIPKVQMSLLR